MAQITSIERGLPADREAELARLRRLAHLLDDAVPLPLGYRAGVDSVVGLIPGFGDAFGAFLSAFIILRAARLGASTPTLARMILNVTVDTLVGSIPVLGDLFDVAFKSNLRNVALLDAHLTGADYRSPSDRRLIALVLGTLIALFVIALAVIVAIVKLFQALV